MSHSHQFCFVLRFLKFVLNTVFYQYGLNSTINIYIVELDRPQVAGTCPMYFSWAACSSSGPTSSPTPSKASRVSASFPPSSDLTSQTLPSSSPSSLWSSLTSILLWRLQSWMFQGSFLQPGRGEVRIILNFFGATTFFFSRLVDPAPWIQPLVDNSSGPHSCCSGMHSHIHGTVVLRCITLNEKNGI